MLTVDAGAVDGDSSKMASKYCKSNASRGKNREMGSALSPCLVHGSEDDKDQKEGQQGLNQPASTLWETCQQPVAASLCCLKSCLVSLQ